MYLYDPTLKLKSAFQTSFMKDWPLVQISLPDTLQAGINKALQDPSLKIIFASRSEARKLGFPDEGVGFFADRKTNSSQHQDLIDRMRKHFHVPSSHELIVIVQDSIRYQNVQSQTALVHEIAHFIFYKVVLEHSNPQKKLAEILQDINIQTELSVGRIHFLNEVHSHAYEIMSAKAISEINQVNWYELFYPSQVKDVGAALRMVPEKIKRDYEYAQPLLLSSKEMMAFVESVLREYVSGFADKL